MTDLAAFTASEQTYFKRDDQASPGEALIVASLEGALTMGKPALKAMLSLLSSVTLGWTLRRERRSVTLRYSSLDCRKEGLMGSTSFPLQQCL
jgi:hypothetical protein